MGAIKDLVDLIVDLDKRVTDRRILDALFPLKQKANDAERELIALERHQLEREKAHAKEVSDIKMACDDKVAQMNDRHADVVRRINSEHDAFVTNTVVPLHNRVAELENQIRQAEECERQMKAGVVRPIASGGVDYGVTEQLRKMQGL